MLSNGRYLHSTEVLNAGGHAAQFSRKGCSISAVEVRNLGRNTHQDGSYLAEFLLEKGYEVHGIVRRASISNHIMDKITLHDGDLSDSSGLIRIIGEIEPDEIYNLAAQSHVQVSFDAPEYSGDVDALGVLRILEAVRVCKLIKKTKVYQASTSELYGKVVGYTGKIEWDTSKPNGTPRKLLDVSKATNLGWTYKTELEEGIRLSYEDFLNNPMRAER